MDSWEEKLLDALNGDDLASVKALLATDDKAKKDQDLGRKEWVRSASSYSPPLHFAAIGSQNEMIRVMVEAGGFDVNSYHVLENGDRVTSLHCTGDVSTIQLLLNLGADPTLAGRWGKVGKDLEGTPLEWARKDGREDLVRVFEKHAEITSFKSMDSLEKLKQKSTKIKDLEEAEAVQSAIEDKRAQKRKMIAKIHKERKELRNDRKKLKTLESDMKGLEDLPCFHNKDNLKGQLEEIETIEKSIKEVLKEEEKKQNTCPVCFLSPRQVFACEDCDGWVCQDCKKRVVTCAKCRVELTGQPLRRCKAMEALMGLSQLSEG